MNEPIPFATLARTVGDASAEVLAAAQSTRSEFDARFERVQKLAQEAKAAKERFYAHGRGVTRPDRETEDGIRFEIAERRLCRASIDSHDAYHAACDEFFLNAAERRPTPPGRAA